MRRNFVAMLAAGAALLGAVFLWHGTQEKPEVEIAAAVDPSTLPDCNELRSEIIHARWAALSDSDERGWRDTRAWLDALRHKCREIDDAVAEVDGWIRVTNRTISDFDFRAGRPGGCPKWYWDEKSSAPFEHTRAAWEAWTREVIVILRTCRDPLWRGMAATGLWTLRWAPLSD